MSPRRRRPPVKTGPTQTELVWRMRKQAPEWREQGPPWAGVPWAGLAFQPPGVAALNKPDPCPAPRQVACLLLYSEGLP